MNTISMLAFLLRGIVIRRSYLLAENLALRQQLAILHRSAPRPRLRWLDRRFWVCLSRMWAGWQAALVIVKPATVVRWHRQGFRYYWRWKSRSKPGRPTVDRTVIGLIKRMSRENILWGAPRIQAELALLGHDLAESTVATYMARAAKPRSPTWRSFLKNHATSLVSIDFCVMPTATFQMLYIFIVLRHDRRRVVHFNVTTHPTAAWVSQQVREAFPFDETPRYLIRDRDGIYGDEFQRCLSNLGIEEVLTTTNRAATRLWKATRLIRVKSSRPNAAKS
jgi:putative transposase